MLKQSRQHTNLPFNWQGHMPDYSGCIMRRNPLDFNFARPAANNCQTIARLQSALMLRRQRIVKLQQETKSCQPLYS